MIADWLGDLLNKARNKEPAPNQDHLPLTDFWINQMLRCEGDCIYEFSRTEPFRLRHVRAADTPITPALINRTVATVVGILEPEQPTLGARVLSSPADRQTGHAPAAALSQRPFRRHASGDGI